MKIAAKTRTELSVLFMYVEKCCHDALHCYADQLVSFWSVLNVTHKWEMLVALIRFNQIMSQRVYFLLL